jgi:UDP-glucuronate decarboxylase
MAAIVPEHLEVYRPSRRDFAEPSYLHAAPYVIHAAGYAAPSIFMKNPVDTIKVNTGLTIQLLEHLTEGGRFLFCSSSEVYRGLSHPALESEIGTTTPYHPRASYIEGKRSGEVIVNAYRESGVRAITARIGLTYGPGTRKHDARVMNQFIEQALTTGKIKLADDGSGSVTYCYAPDLAKMLWNVLMRGVHGVYNVGGTQSMTIAELAVQIGRLTGAEILTSNGVIGTSQTRMDMSRYNNEFGVPEYTSFEDGLKATIAYQRNLYGII